jgi:hypothetical protein
LYDSYFGISGAMLQRHAHAGLKSCQGHRAERLARRHFAVRLIIATSVAAIRLMRSQPERLHRLRENAAL